MNEEYATKIEERADKAVSGVFEGWGAGQDHPELVRYLIGAGELLNDARPKICGPLGEHKWMSAAGAFIERALTHYGVKTNMYSTDAGREYADLVSDQFMRTYGGEPGRLSNAAMSILSDVQHDQQLNGDDIVDAARRDGNLDINAAKYLLSKTYRLLIDLEVPRPKGVRIISSM